MEKDKKDKDDVLIIVGENRYFPPQFIGEGIIRKEKDVSLDELFKTGSFFFKCKGKCASIKEAREVIQSSGWVIYCKKEKEEEKNGKR